MNCAKCERPMRPYGAKAEDHPGTVARAVIDVCRSCYQRRGGQAPAVAADAPVVPVKTFLRPSTYKQLTGHAANRGMSLPNLLSLLADAALKPVEWPKPREDTPAPVVVAEPMPGSDVAEGLRKPHVRLDQEQRAQVAAMYATGAWSKAQLGIKFRVSQATIANILREHDARKASA